MQIVRTDMHGDMVHFINMVRLHKQTHILMRNKAHKCHECYPVVEEQGGARQQYSCSALIINTGDACVRIKCEHVFYGDMVNQGVRTRRMTLRC